MKYDLKAMKFSPDEGDLFLAFLWDCTKEGYDYWNNQFENGVTPEGQAKWDAMQRQWNEENAPAPDSPSMHGMLSEMWRNPTGIDSSRSELGESKTGALVDLGDKVTVIANTAGHEFEIGSVVECIDGVSSVRADKRFSDGSDWWWMKPEDYTINGTTQQRYVVLTDGETIICTRSEAKDLAAGGVDAVYKLGDKVSVTVKVEFDT